MRIVAKRLVRGMDLKREIERVMATEGIGAGVILSGVGCVSKGCFRVADGETIKAMEEPLEILSLSGTLSPGGLHLHISYGDVEGRVWGGHLAEGNIINTTCELVVGVISTHVFTREFDHETGYKEIGIEKEAAY